MYCIQSTAKSVYQTVIMRQANPDGRLAIPVSDYDHVQGTFDPVPSAFTKQIVVLVEYGDYQSPGCRETYNLMQTQAIQNQIGARLCYVFRHFPQHPQARKAAEAAEAAAAQGRFWQMHHKLFEQSPALSDADLVQCAIEVELDVMQFLRDLSEHRHAHRIDADLQSGVASGVQEVPAVFLNGIRSEPCNNIESLLAAIAASDMRSG